MLKSKLSLPNPACAGLSPDKTLNRLSQNFSFLGLHWAAQYSGVPDKTLSVHGTQGDHITLIRLHCNSNTPDQFLFNSATHHLLIYNAPQQTNCSFQTSCFFSCYSERVLSSILFSWCSSNSTAKMQHIVLCNYSKWKKWKIYSVAPENVSKSKI